MTNSVNKFESKKDISAADNIVKLEKLYVKEINCKIPYAPSLFESPEFKEKSVNMIPLVEISTKVQPISVNKYEVTLHAIVQGKGDNVSLFVLEVQQSGIFEIKVPQEQIKRVIETSCVGYLHVYLSQVISSSIAQAGFAPIMLQPLQPLVSQNIVKEESIMIN